MQLSAIHLFWLPCIFTFTKCIVTGNRRDWLGSLANIKGTNKDAKIYVGRSTTLHNLLFYAHTLCMSYITNTFPLISSQEPNVFRLLLWGDCVLSLHAPQSVAGKCNPWLHFTSE